MDHAGSRREASTTTGGAPARRAPRPGRPLPLSPVAGRTAESAAVVRDAAREAEARRRLDAPPESAPAPGRPAELAVPEPKTPATSDAAPGPAAGKAEGSAPPSAAPSEATGTPADLGSLGRAAPSVPAEAPPSLPRVPLPDLSGIRAPLVPPPPLSARRRAAAILRSSGRTPAAHHAEVQRAVDRVADLARSARAEVVFQVGGIAFDARHAIEQLADRVPGIVGGGEARIRAAASAAIASVNAIADAQLAAVMEHARKVRDGLESQGDQTEVTLHRLLMQEAPQVLRDAKAEMDAELAALAGEAGTRIAQVKTGSRPATLDTGEAVSEAPPPAPTTATGAAPPAPRHTTWAAARQAMTDALMVDLPGNRTAQYGNLHCALSVPPMVAEQQRAYEAANADTIAKLTSDETRTRFFDITFGLIMPTVAEEAERAEPVADDSYTGHLNANLSEQYSRLDDASRRIARQIDEKRVELVTRMLDPARAKSLPAQAIDGLRSAGRKLEAALHNQALVVEASLTANLAALVRHYPEIVARIEPLIASGEFLEATAMLGRLAEAEASVGSLRSGQVALVAEQAAAALGRARASFDQQAASLWQMADRASRNIGQTAARAHYHMVRTTVMYTGRMDEGVSRAFPQIHAHAEEVAERLLGPKQASGQKFSNIRTHAASFLNGVIDAEWQGYLARVNGMEQGFGGVAGAGATLPGDAATPFGSIRNDAHFDAGRRGADVEAAMTPPPLTNAERSLYLVSPFAVAIVDAYTNPDESKVVTALSIPWPGPCAADEVHEAQSGNSIITLIRERMGDEAEQADILKLFDRNADVRAEGKAGLLEGSSRSTGISADAALALSQSLTADELASPVMSPARRQSIAEELRSTLKPASMEVAGAYLNGEPDLALAIRMRQLFDRQAGKEEAEQLRTGEEMDRLIRAELFAGGLHTIPQARLDAMRDAAFLRFDEASRADRPAPVVRARPAAPPPDRAALTAAQLSWNGRPPPPPAPSATVVPAQPPSVPAAAPQPAPAAPPPPAPSVGSGRALPATAPPEPERTPPNEMLTPDGVATDRTRSLDEARRGIVAYMNRPRLAHYRRHHDPFADQDLRFASARDGRLRSYDPETGAVTVAPAVAVQAYNTAMILHGTQSLQALGARAGASYRRISQDGSLSNNQINELDRNFSDPAYAAFRAEWDHATPARRVAMAKRHEEMERRHADFLRETARSMGMPEAGLDDPAAVREFVASRLGDQFAKEGRHYRRAGTEIVEGGRITVETGVALAAGGNWDGTNEALMQSVLANRSDAELDVRLSNGETRREYARRIASDEMSGDDWQQAEEKLRGEDRTELDRFETVTYLENQQLEEGTGDLGEAVMAGTWQRRHLVRSRQQAERRLQGAAEAGLADYNRRMDAAGRPDLRIDVGEVPLRGPDGELHPLIRRFAMDGNGRLRGEGPPMSALLTQTRQATDYYREEIDRNEGIFTGIITALAIAISVALLFIPGINLIAAGVIVALLAGGATILVKQGMRGGRYGWEEMAVDIGMTVIEAATAGIGGAMSKGAGAAARMATTGEKIALGRIASVGARLQTRFGPVAAPIIQGAITGAASTAAGVALDDRLWDDGIGRGLGRVVGHGLKGGLSGGANAAVTGAVTRGLDRRLAPVTATRGMPPDRLTRLGRALGPGGRELLTEMLSNTTGALSGEAINILGDLAMDRHAGGWAGAFERLGKAGLREFVSAGGRSTAQQIQRARYNRLSAEIQMSGREPSAADLRRLNWLGQVGGVVPPGTRVEDLARDLAAVRRRLPDLPEGIRAHVARMGLEKAMQVIRALDSGDLGTRGARLELVAQLAKDVAGMDVAALDRALVEANTAHAPARRARKAAIAEAGRQMREGLGPAEQGALARLDLADLAQLPGTVREALARALRDGRGDIAGLARGMIPDERLARRIGARLDDAAGALRAVRTGEATRQGRIRADLLEAAPPAARTRIDALGPREAEALHRALSGATLDMARAAAILRRGGFDPRAAGVVARRMSGRVLRLASRVAQLDNVPEAHRAVMLDLSDDALMEVRLAQFTRRPLSGARIDAMVQAAAARRPGLDPAALVRAIRATQASRYGRPGFREALGMKRALVDLVPFGMKRRVLRTPVLALPEEAFLAHVRGKGHEQAVTLIVNGAPVVLLRRGANPAVLAEEGIHVLQYHDPHYRDRLMSFDEGRIAGWDRLPVDAQVRLYRAKVEIEIDGQQRMIGRLRDRAARGLFASTRREAEVQLRQAQATLARLTAARARAAALGPDTMNAIAAGVADPPDWLRQPARMFSKTGGDSDLIERLHPGMAEPLRDAFADLTRALPTLTRQDREAILGLLRTVRGAVPSAELVTHLQNIRGLPANEVVTALRGLFSDAGKTSLIRPAAERIRRRMERKPGLDGEDRALVRAALNRLTSREAHGAPLPDLELAKRALLLALDRMPPNTSNAEFMLRFRTAAEVLGIPPVPVLQGVKGKSGLQAILLEGLAATPALLKASAGREVLTQADLFRTVRDLFGAKLGHLPLSAQEETLRFLVRSHATGAPYDAMGRIVDLIRVTVRAHEADAHGAERILTLALAFIAREPGRITELLPKFAALIDSAVDFGAGSLSTAQTRAAGKVTVHEMNLYFEAAQANPEIARSLVRLGSRAIDGLDDDDVAAIRGRKPVTVGQKDFSQRFGRPLADAVAVGDDIPIVSKREQAAEDVRKLADAAHPAMGLTIQEARAIAQRLDVLETSVVFSALVGTPTSREALLRAFLADLASQRRGQIRITDAETAERRGAIIEAAFRNHVRKVAIALIDRMAVGVEIPGPKGPVLLSEEARLRLINLLIRGEAAEPPHVADAEVASAVAFLRRAYLQRVPAAEQEAVGAAFDSLVRRGIISTEATAKGKMQERLIEALAALTGRAAGRPAVFDDLTAPPQADTVRTFTSIDGGDRSTDHVLEVTGSGALPAGMRKGDRIQVDSKAGPGAFSDAQFRRYFVELARFACSAETSDTDSLFARGKSNSLLYITDSRENMEATRTKVAAILREILADPIADRVVVRIEGKAYDLTAEHGITPDMIRRNADKFAIRFGCLARPDAATDGEALGPFLIWNGSDLVRRILDEQQAAAAKAGGR